MVHMDSDLIGKLHYDWYCTFADSGLPNWVAGDDDDDDVDAHPGDQHLSLPNQFLSKYSFQNVTSLICFLFKARWCDVSFT